VKFQIKKGIQNPEFQIFVICLPAGQAGILKFV
jgi:hypothetical protein